MYKLTRRVIDFLFSFEGTFIKSRSCNFPSTLSTSFSPCLVCLFFSFLEDGVMSESKGVGGCSGQHPYPGRGCSHYCLASVLMYSRVDAWLILTIFFFSLLEYSIELKEAFIQACLMRVCRLYQSLAS